MIDYLRVMENLYGWLFWWNEESSVWQACQREHYIAVSNDYDSSYGIRSSSIDTLMSLIIKGKGVLQNIIKIPTNGFITTE